MRAYVCVFLYVPDDNLCSSGDVFFSDAFLVLTEISNIVHDKKRTNVSYDKIRKEFISGERSLFVTSVCKRASNIKKILSKDRRTLFKPISVSACAQSGQKY